MSDRDTITLPREAVEKIHEAWSSEVYPPAASTEWYDIMDALRTALAAEPTKQEAKQEPVAYFDLQKQVFYWARPTMIDVPMTIALEPLPLYAAPPTAAPESTHPGCIIGSHWLETAYSRVCAGEAEADVLRDCGWERVTDAEALRRDAERYRWLRGEHSRIDPCIKAVCKHPLQRQGHTWAEIHDLDAIFDAAMGDKT